MTVRDNPIIENFQWNADEHTLLVSFNSKADNGGFVLYAPLVHDLTDGSLATFSPYKNSGYEIVGYEPFKIKYRNPIFDKYKHPQKVIKGKAYIQLSPTIELYPDSLTHLLDSELKQRLQLK